MNTEEIENEILPLLQLKNRPDVRVIAAEYFLRLTGCLEGKETISKNIKFLSGILNLVHDDVPKVVADTYSALINLSAEDHIVLRMLLVENIDDLIKDVLIYILDKDSEHADLACKFMSNFTRIDKAARKVVDSIMTFKDIIGFDKIILCFCTVGYNKSANLHFLGPFLSNLTQIQDVRKFVLDKERCVVQRLLPFTRFTESTERRHGIVATLRNCLFESEYHDWLLSNEIDILTALLYPLAGPEEFDDDEMERLPDDLQYLPGDKEREPNHEIRKMLIEAIFQLCSTKSGRMFVKQKNTYVIMRELHKWENNDAVIQALENLIQILIGDEPAPEHSNLKEVVIPNDLVEQFEKAD